MSGLFGLFERRNPENPAVPLTSTSLLDWFGGARVDAGVQVNEHTALKMSAVFRCVSLISSVSAALPLHTYVKGTKDRATSALLEDPHPELTPIELWRLTYVHRCLTGNAYLQKIRNGGGEVTELWPITPNRVKVGRVRPSEVNPQGKMFEVTDDDGRTQPMTPREVMHLPGLSYDGLLGMSLVQAAAQGIGLALAAESYGAKLFGSGNLLSGILKTDQRLEQNDADRLQARWQQMSQGLDRAHKVAVLDSGAAFQSLTMPSSDAQMLECVVAETMFSMADGTLRRADQIEPGVFVMAWDGQKLVPGRVSDVFPMPVAETLRVTTACGRDLTTSHKHPYLIARRPRTAGGRYNGTFDATAAWIQAKDVRVGDYVRVGLGWDRAEGSLSPESAWAMGALIGDGHLRSNGALGFTTIDGTIRDRLQAWLATFGGNLRQSGRSSNYTITTGGVGRGGSRLRDELKRLGVLGSSGLTKHVPDEVMKGGPSVWAGFLSGYLDTDGTVNREDQPQPQVIWSSISHRLLTESQHLLAMLGIGASVRPHDRTGGPRVVMGVACVAKPSWVLTVCGRANVAALAALLTPAHPVKAARFQHWATQEGRANGARSDIRWTRVVDVADAGDQATCGITIDGYHTHVTNGLVTHNSRHFQITDASRFWGVPPFLMMETEKSTSWGCLPGDALVFTTTGPKPIEDVEPGEEVWSYSDTDGMVASKVTAWHHTGYKPLLTIRTATRELRVTANHRVPVRRYFGTADGRRPGACGWETVEVSGGEIRAGDYLLVPNGLNDGDRTTAPNGRALTVEAMELCGLYTGDGSADKNRVEIAHGVEDPHMPYYRESIRREFGTEPYVDKRGTRTRFSSVEARSLLECGFTGKAHTKRVPGWVFRLTEELRLAYLRGYLDADGGIARGVISFASVHPALLEDVRHLCISVGVPVGRVRLSRRGGSGHIRGRAHNSRDKFVLNLSMTEQNHKIGSNHPRKLANLRAEPMQRTLRYSAGWEGGLGNTTKAKRRESTPGGTWALPDVRLQRVVSVEHGRVAVPVYDITVNEHAHYVADGVIVHNTGLEQQAQGWVTFDLHPTWLAPTEQRISKELAAPGTFAKYKSEGLLRGDSTARGMFYRVMREVGAMSANDIRELEDRPPIPDGDSYLQPLNLVPLGTAPSASSTNGGTGDAPQPAQQ